MENNISIGGLSRQKRILERFLLALGFCLFILLSVRGLNKIGDRAVAAGEAQKSAVVDHVYDLNSYYTENQVPSFQTLGGILEPSKAQANEDEKTTKDNTQKDSNKKVNQENTGQNSQNGNAAVVRAQKDVKEL